MIVKEDKPLGIVTERDILAKIVAAGKKPEKVKLADIMTSPLITVTPNADITEVARLMAKHNVRRLGVVSQEQLVGIITTADIMSVSTHLISTSEDLRNLVCRDSDQGEYVSGYCEECKTYSINLASIEGMLVCEQCRDVGE
ncbi:MAG: CBS domain-containing protein, partial [Candidatus Thermoplasmatota archaeon]|nr:CBS domain-containing protein [Candidatus Thermoplasmatota archaeon]